MKEKKDEVDKKYIRDLAQTLNLGKREMAPLIRPIFFDGRQYSIRIPKKLAEAIGIKPERDKFQFKIEEKNSDGKLTKQLIGVLIHGE